MNRLPLEIRVMIYEACLCVEGSLVPYPDPLMLYRRRARPPGLALLGTSQAIRHEGLPIFFAKNTWGITLADISGRRPEDTLWNRYGTYIRHIDLKYSGLGWWRSYESCFGIGNLWKSTGKAIDCCPNVWTVQIDVTDMNCPLNGNSTRLIETLFTQYMVHFSPEVMVLVRGVHGPRQFGAVMAWRTQDLRGKATDLAVAKTHTVALHDRFNMNVLKDRGLERWIHCRSALAKQSSAM